MIVEVGSVGCSQLLKLPVLEVQPDEQSMGRAAAGCAPRSSYFGEDNPENWRRKVRQTKCSANQIFGLENVNLEFKSALRIFGLAKKSLLCVCTPF